jgi:hypothetical protein
MQNAKKKKKPHCTCFQLRLLLYFKQFKWTTLKVKLSLYRPWSPIRLWDVEALTFYTRADNSRLLSFTVSSWEWVYATNLSRLQRETRERERERERETSKRHVGEAHSILTTAILLPQRLGCYWGKIVSLRMLTIVRLADWRLTTAQQRSTGQNLPPDLYEPAGRPLSSRRFLVLISVGGWVDTRATVRLEGLPRRSFGKM